MPNDSDLVERIAREIANGRNGNQPERVTAAKAIDLARPQWQPIETAPLDGTPFLAFLPEGGGEVRDYSQEPGFAVMWRRGHEFIGYYDGQLPLGVPTHWMLLPDPPTE